MKRRIALLGVLIAAPAGADAGPLTDAIARHGEADVAALRAQLPGDANTRCTLGAVYAKRNDLTRAMLYLDGCADAALDAEIADPVGKLARDLKRKVRESDLAELSIVSEPAGIAIELDTLPGEKLATPVSIYVKAGDYKIRYTVGDRKFEKAAVAKAYARSAVILDAVVKPTKPTKDGVVNFDEDNATEQQSGPPPDIKHPNLMKDKYRGITGPRGPELEDPLAARAGHGTRPWFGLRLGGGMFDDGSTAAAFRPSVAGAVRVILNPRVFLAARLDWSRRGGNADPAVDTIGASAGAGATLIATDAIGVALIGQLRGDLRFADTRAMMAVRRGGASAAASLEVAFPSTPLTAGVRFEQGLTELVAGARDRAVLVEVGVDWR